MPSRRSSRAEQLGFDWAAPRRSAAASTRGGSGRSAGAERCERAGLLIAGVDEAGRGPLAGPVVAAAVILDPGRRILGLRDSKVLTALRRDTLHDRIREHALCCGVGIATVEEIDRINILQATLLAMQRAVRALRLTPHKVVVDGNRLPVLPMLAEAIVDGDAKVRAISAASIIAKVTRDRLCAELHERHPHYGFDVHKGYPTPMHLEALRAHGPCEAHRRSFGPVRDWAALKAAESAGRTASATSATSATSAAGVPTPVLEALAGKPQPSPQTRTRSARRASGGLEAEEPGAW